MVGSRIYSWRVAFPFFRFFDGKMSGFTFRVIVPRSSRLEVFCKKGVLRKFAKFTGKHLCRPKACNLIKKETLAQVFSCEFCEFSKNIFFPRTLPVAASVFFIPDCHIKQLW